MPRTRSPCFSGTPRKARSGRWLGGVPMLSGGSGQDLVEGGRTAGAAATEDYVKNRYHQPADEYDPKWNWAGALEDLTIYYRMGRTLADGSAWPNWYPASEFRKIRDESRAGK